MMNTFQLSCFLSVAETLNFARAAEQLNITQPAVTHQIRTLESELNVKLFKRTTRTVSLTDEGSIFIQDAKNILGITMRAKKRFERPFDDEVRVFSIGCHSYTQLFLLPDILRSLTALHPNLHPRLQVVPFQHLYRLLEEEDVDVVIGFQESDLKKIPGIYKEIQKIPVFCVCSNENPLSCQSSVHIEDLKEQSLILNDPAKTPLPIAKLQGHLMDGRSPSQFYFSDSIEAAMVLAKAGLGISLLPDLFPKPDDGLTFLPIKDVAPLSFGLYYKTLKSNPILKDFIQIVRSQMLSE